MECTQRLECTQESYPAPAEKVTFEQIGFLGICGEKYPVKKGPNKIGRDPQTCNIVLKLNSISRQHAVLNVLNYKEFMLMDLDSANKTKLVDKILQPYIPYPIKNGDTVQFGDIFGIFRLLDDDDDLPMTQAIPDTPVASRNVSKLYNVPSRVIPESPDVSDKDDSFIAPSQPKKGFSARNSSYHFIKPSGQSISIQPIGTNKIDNIYWNSAKKSCSFNSSSQTLNVSVNSNPAEKENTEIRIHELETQIPDCNDDIKNTCIYTAETQVPTVSPQKLNNKKSDSDVVKNISIYAAETQIPDVSPLKSNDDLKNNSIYAAETQVPTASKVQNLPELFTINDQSDLECEFFKNNENRNIFRCETQTNTEKKGQSLSLKTKDKPIEELQEIISNKGSNASDEEILFDEIDNNVYDDEFESQPIFLPDSSPYKNNGEESLESKYDTKNDSNNKISVNNLQYETTAATRYEKLNTKEKIINSAMGVNKVILLDKKLEGNSKSINSNVVSKLPSDDDITDCEDEIENNSPIVQDENEFIDISMLPTQNIFETSLCENKNEKSEDCVVSFEDMATQVILNTTSKPSKDDSKYDNTKPEKVISDIADLPTQIIAVSEAETKLEDLGTQIIEMENVGHVLPESDKNKSAENDDSSFKIPFQSPLKLKRTNIPKLTPRSLCKEKEIFISADEVDNYYTATQDIFDDLCSQKEVTAKEVEISNLAEDEFVPCSIENYEVGEKFPHLMNELSPGRDISTVKDNKILSKSNMSTKKIININFSDNSDLEETPNKVPHIKVMEIDLPNSQEIKSSVSLNSKALITESSSDSEIENNSEEQSTPILFRRKRKANQNVRDAKIDLTNRFNVDQLPSRVITRVRKATLKAQLNDDNMKKPMDNILKPKYLTEQEDNLDKELITENISRLKNKKDSSTKNKDINTKDLNHNTNSKVQSTQPQKSIDQKKLTTQKQSKKEKANVANQCETTILNGKEKDNKSLRRNSRKSDKKSHQNKNDHTTETNESSVYKRTSKAKMKTDKKIDAKSSPIDGTEIKKNTYEAKCKENDKSKESPEAKNESAVVDTVLRRSKRQRKVKIKSDSQPLIVNKPCLKPNNSQHELSAIYSLSSDSGTDSPRGIKRSRTCDIEMPLSKRSRSTTNSVPIRSTPARSIRSPHVLFTGFSELVIKEVSEKLPKLGSVVVVSDVLTCTVLVTQSVKRTFKLLCAVGLGKPIVGIHWVQACHDTNTIVDPWLYLIKDEAAEKRLSFNLQRTLVGSRNFLKGYNVSSTPSVSPKEAEMKLIVECSGGTWKEGGPNWVCISNKADKSLWPSLKRRGATLVTAEFILGGVLRQQLDIENNLLK